MTDSERMMAMNKMVMAVAVVFVVACSRGNEPLAAATASVPAAAENTSSSRPAPETNAPLCGLTVDRAAVARAAEQEHATYDDVRAVCDRVQEIDPFLRQIHAAFFGTQKRDEIDDAISRLSGDLNFKVPDIKPIFRSAAPSLSPFGGPACGQHLHNAYYCEADSDIYFDPIFLAKLRARGRAALDTSGDYTAMFALAHEYGHAVSLRLHPEIALLPRNPVASMLVEGLADCLGGAFTRVAIESGAPPEIRREAIQALTILGDPEGASLEIQDAHGDASTRIQWFDTGFRQGAHACRVAPQLQPLTTGFDDLVKRVGK